MLKRAKSFITGERKKKNETTDLALPESAHLGRTNFIITTNNQCLLTNNAVKRRNAPANSNFRRPNNDLPQQNRYSLDITNYNDLLNDGSSKESNFTTARPRGNSFSNKEKGEIVRGNFRKARKCAEIREEREITAEVVPGKLGFFRRSKSLIIGSRKKREKDKVEAEPDVFSYVSFRK